MHADDHEFIAGVVNCAERVVGAMVGQLDNDRYTGGYLCVEDEDGHVLAITMIGYVSEVLREKALVLCKEKCDRAFQNGHDSAAQSRDDEHDKYPGAFKVRRHDGGKVYYIGFSGLPGTHDEIAAIYPAFVFHLDADIPRLLSYSNNVDLFNEALELVAVDKVV